MRTWNDYKEHVKAVDSESYADIQEMESVAAVIGAIVEKRNSLGLSQRQLAAMCGLPQSSVARVESMRTTPKLDTLLKIMSPLGLRLDVAMA